MRRQEIGSLILIALLFMGGLALAQEKDPFQIKTQAQQDGESVLVDFEAIFPGTKEAFWQVLTDYASYPKFVPGVADAEYLGKLQGMDRVYLQVYTPIPFPDVWNILDVQQDQALGKLEWKMRKGNMRKNQGSFQVEIQPGRIRIKGEAYINPGSFIPRRLVIWASKRYTPEFLSAFGDELVRRSKVEIQKAALVLP